MLVIIGSRGGKLYGINCEKHSIIEVWNSSEEAEDSDISPCIKRLVWYALQTPTDEPCLFILLGNDGEAGLTLKSVIVGLAPIGDHGERVYLWLRQLIGAFDFQGRCSRCLIWYQYLAKRCWDSGWSVLSLMTVRHQQSPAPSNQFQACCC
jgi:hypothetical protein